MVASEAESFGRAFLDAEDIEEFPLLLTSEAVRGLIDAAGQKGVSPAGLVRHLIADYLQQRQHAGNLPSPLMLKGASRDHF